MWTIPTLRRSSYTTCGPSVPDFPPGRENGDNLRPALAPSNPDIIWVGTGDAASGRIPLRGFGVWKSTDAGKTWGKKALENLARSFHVDYHAFWIDPRDSNHLILGSDGGLAVSWDFGAQYLLRSVNRGDAWQEISPDLTTNDPVKLKGNIEFCTLTTISESPVTPGLIWVGSDDGKVQVTRDGAGTWMDRTAKVAAAGGPADYYVTRVLASPHREGTAFITKSGWHRDVYAPYVFRTDDYGETWTPLRAGLPEGTVYALAQDRKNADLLFVGTEMGVFATVDGGKAWFPFGTGLPSAGRFANARPRSALR
jgi:photosystem II stability/assembly factor-like uncharacterized protein